MSTALVVDDDETVGDVVAAYLVHAGMTVRRVADGIDALAAAAEEPPDIVVLDLMLPGVDGLEVCRRLRRNRPDVPIIMLTARGEEDDRIRGLEVGADDYMTKPFSPRELVLRVQSVLRRSGSALPSPDESPEAPAVAVDGNLEIDRRARRVRLAGRELSLTVREFDLLSWFLAHPGRAVRREELMHEVWGWDFGDAATVTVHVSRLREKIEPVPSAPVRLVTVFGVGYRWDPAP
ncbi:response regulator transcription factor [Microbacterium sp. 4R-513]|uniref:response regulator transcription factor n=1 Tax=Microbacterium sp. 4R-513 TaxID=2567934 RepID=UPI001F49A8B1|nr:response regulator transcription factor [Microbacterium sp. 4R-513]